jgi:membrane-bound ClpP family serine protease
MPRWVLSLQIHCIVRNENLGVVMLFRFIFLIIVSNIVHPARAMEFFVDKSALYVVGKGEILSGNAQRLEHALAKVKADRDGMKLLFLDSPGGSVAAAFEVAKVIDLAGNVVTGVRQGASCASACASILFIAGKIHIVGEGGKIGLHSCYNGKTNKADPLCNQRIAEFALEHGTEFGAVAAPMNLCATRRCSLVFRERSSLLGLR